MRAASANLPTRCISQARQTHKSDSSSLYNAAKSDKKSKQNACTVHFLFSENKKLNGELELQETIDDMRIAISAESTRFLGGQERCKFAIVYYVAR